MILMPHGRLFLEAFEVEIVELLFPKIFNEIAWELGTESLDMELKEIQKEIFGERMFRYFYRILDKFRYKYKDRSEIVAAAIYTYKGNCGKDNRYVYKLPKMENEILIYNFKTIDVEKINLEKINNNNPLKLVFKIQE